MKRRDFLKQNGELWLYSILFGKIALSCTKESIGKNKTISHDIKGVYELVQISFNGGCINNDKYYMHPYTIIIAESFDIVENLDKNRSKIDFYLKINAVALVKTNFDIINTPFHIIDRFSRASKYSSINSNNLKKGNYKPLVSYTLATDNPEQQIIFIEMKEPIKYPLIWSKEHSGFADHKKIPHLLNHKIFNKIFGIDLKSLLS